MTSPTAIQLGLSLPTTTDCNCSSSGSGSASVDCTVDCPSPVTNVYAHMDAGTTVQGGLLLSWVSQEIGEFNMYQGTPGFPNYGAQPADDPDMLGDTCFGFIASTNDYVGDNPWFINGPAFYYTTEGLAADYYRSVDVDYFYDYLRCRWVCRIDFPVPAFAYKPGGGSPFGTYTGDFTTTLRSTP